MEGIKGLFKDSVVYGLGNVIQKLMPIIVIPIIIKYLGKEALKFYDLAFIYTFLFCAIILLSLDTAESVFYFDKKKNNFDKRQVLSYSFFLQALSLLFNFLLIFSFQNYIGSALFANDTSIKHYWLVSLWFIPGYMLCNYSLNVLVWQNRSTAYLIICLLNTILVIAGSVIAVKYFQGTILHVIYVQIAAITLCGVISIFLIRKDIFVWPFPLNDALIQRLFWFGVPFALTAFFRQLIPSIDRYFLLHYNLSNQLPYFILAVKISSLFTVATNAFILAFTPYSLSKLNQDDAEKEISKLFKLVSVLTFLSVPVLLLFKDLLIEIFANASYAEAAKLLPFLFLGWVFDLFAYFSILGVYKSQNSGIVLLLLVIGTFIISALNMLLIPYFNIYGAAISFFLTKLIMFFLTLVFLRKHFKVRLDVISFFGMFFIACFYCYLIYKVSFSVYIILLLLLCVVVFFHLKNSFKHYNLQRFFKSAKPKIQAR